MATNAEGGLADRRYPLVIIGAGGFGREVLDVVEAANAATPTFDFVGFIDDAVGHPELLEARGAPVLDGMGDPRAAGSRYVVAIGDGAARMQVSRRAAQEGLHAAVLRHPTATFGALDQIGEGLIACAHVSVTTNVVLGGHVHLNLNATIGHDCVIGDFVTVFPGVNVSGDVHLGDGVMLGTGASIIQGVTVGSNTFVGAGAVVTRDLPEDVIAVGSPARPTRSRT